MCSKFELPLVKRIRRSTMLTLYKKLGSSFQTKTAMDAAQKGSFRKGEVTRQLTQL